VFVGVAEEVVEEVDLGGGGMGVAVGAIEVGVAEV
jgi:hypothetical protein